MSLSFLCGLFGYTRQAYYKHLRRNREGSLSDTLLLERVGCYRKLMPRLGGRKLWHLLQQDGFPSGSVIYAAFGKQSSGQTSEEIQRYDLLAALDA